MKSTLTLLAIVISHILFSQSSSGPKNAGTYSNDASVGSVSWANPGNAQTSDNNYATSSVVLGILSSTKTNYLVASNFGFTLSGSAVITGIKVEVERQYNILLGVLSSISDNSVKLVKGGVIGGTDKAGGAWPSNDAYATYGGSADLWGRTWSAVDINASNFGVAISASVFAGLASLTMDALIDHIRVTVYFNIPVPVTFASVQATEVFGRPKLSWSTVTESGSRIFIAEKWQEAQQAWVAFDSVYAAGESNGLRSYSAWDNTPDALNIYRVCQFDYNGVSSYSETVQLRTDPGTTGQVRLYPNPAGPVVQVHSLLNINLIELRNMSGQLVRQVSLPGSTHEYTLSLENIPGGMYQLMIQNGEKRTTSKLIIRK